MKVQNNLNFFSTVKMQNGRNKSQPAEIEMNSGDIVSFSALKKIQIPTGLKSEFIDFVETAKLISSDDYLDRGKAVAEIWKTALEHEEETKEIMPQLLKILREALNDSSAYVRSLAVEGFGKIGNRSILPKLQKMMQKDRSSSVRMEAQLAIKKIQESFSK